MLDENDKVTIKPSVLTVQIIVIALVVGVSGFTFFAYQQVNGPNGLEAEIEAVKPNSFTNLAVGLAAMSVVMHLVVPSFISASGVKTNISNFMSANNDSSLKQDQDSRNDLLRSLCGVYQVATIVACALLEGAAFLNSYAYMANKQAISLIVSLALITLMLFRFSTVGRVTNWIEKILRANELEQQFSQR
jgi:hypothetical protein